MQTIWNGICTPALQTDIAAFVERKQIYTIQTLMVHVLAWEEIERRLYTKVYPSCHFAVNITQKYIQCQKMKLKYIAKLQKMMRNNQLKEKK